MSLYSNACSAVSQYLVMTWLLTTAAKTWDKVSALYLGEGKGDIRLPQARALILDFVSQFCSVFGLINMKTWIWGCASLTSALYMLQHLVSPIESVAGWSISYLNNYNTDKYLSHQSPADSIPCSGPVDSKQRNAWKKGVEHKEMGEPQILTLHECQDDLR